MPTMRHIENACFSNLQLSLTAIAGKSDNPIMVGLLMRTTGISMLLAPLLNQRQWHSRTWESTRAKAAP